MLFSPDDDGGSGGTSGGGETTPPNPPPAGENWEVKYKQLQTSYNKLFDEARALREGETTLKTTISDLQAQVATLQADKAKFEGDATTKAKEVDVEKAAHATTRLEGARAKLLLTEFPELAKFEAAGTLPTAANVEEMRTKFKAFAETLKGLISSGVSSTLSGASPSSTQTPPAPVTADEVYQQMMRVAGMPGKESEYLKLRDLWDKLAEEEAKKS